MRLIDCKTLTFFPTKPARLVAALLVGVLAIMGASTANADTLGDLKREFGALNPAKAREMLAKCENRELEHKQVLRKLNDLSAKYAEIENSLKRLSDKQTKLENRKVPLMARLREAQKKNATLWAKCVKDSKGGGSTYSIDSCRRHKVFNESLEPVRDELHKIKLREIDHENSRAKYKLRRSDILKSQSYLWRDASIPVSYLARIDHRRTWETTNAALRDWIADEKAPCRRIRAWARQGRSLDTEPKQPDPIGDDVVKRGKSPDVEPKQPDPLGDYAGVLAARAANAIKACDFRRAKELMDDLQDRVARDDPRLWGLAAAANRMLMREYSINDVIDGAKQHYNEGRALELEGKPEAALESYRVAMSQLRAARDATGCEDRRRKVVETISRVTERVAALQKPKEKEVAETKSPIEQTEIEDANQACAEQFGTNAVMSTVDLRTSEYWCKCGKGYAWNSDNSGCVKAKSRKALAREACRKSYPNSIVVGFKSGKPMCNCPKGRQWNKNRSACIRARRPQTARRQSQGLDPGTAAAWRAIGGLIGQAIRSGQYSRARRHAGPTRAHPPSAGRPPTSRGTGSWKDRFGKQAPMTRRDRGLYGGGAGPR